MVRFAHGLGLGAVFPGSIFSSLVTSKFPTQGDALRFELEGFAPIMLQVD